jgi:immune inhibitor A
MRFAFPRAKSRRALLVGMPILALAATALTVSNQAGAGQQDPVRAQIGADEYYINYVEPRVQPDREAKEVKNANGVFVSPVNEAQAYDRKFARGNPVTAKVLSNLESESIKTGKSPRQIKQAKSAQVAKLLTILIEFNEAANDDFTGSMVPGTVFDSRACVPGTIQNGPLHNQIPNPATLAHEDNNTMWVPDFSTEYFDKILYTSEGITERVRTDLTGPDGQPGISLAGYTMRNMYSEMSKGAYTVDGQATPWVKVAHSEAWYGASRCFQDENGDWVAGVVQSMNGHPSNPLGPGALAVDAVETLAASDASFPWSDYDIEDQGDRDGDGNFYEPDGVIDHLVLVHAGEDKSGGGGAQGAYSIWAHSSSVAGGYTIPGTDIQVSNYIVQPEDSGVGVFAHEYGHDLGLPDLYDTSGNADSDVDFWDLMSSGSHSGPIFQSIPTHMGLWDKWVLGWADPVVLTPGKTDRDVQLGQTSQTPRGTQDGIKINLPNKVVTLATPHSATNMWYTGADQDLADIKVARQVQVPNAADAKFWMWNNYIIEDAWDFGFVEVSIDGGNTWTELKVFDAAGNLVTTDDGYLDPNNTISVLFGGKKYGLTGDSHGWRHDYVNLGAYAGQTVQVRLRMATDWAFQERGWFADDFSVSGGGVETPVDDVESGANGWTATGGTWGATGGPGWRTASGTIVQAHYYLAEWRNFNGFDEGLKYAYDTTYARDAWKVEKVKYNAPGMLVWYRDTTYGGVNDLTANSTALPSYGSKGGLLIVDSHFDPLRRSGTAATKDPTTLKNISSRPQSSNAAFSLNPTYPFQECLEAEGEPYSQYCTSFLAQPAVPTFTDAKGWYPGFELRGSSLFARDVDASVVLPSAGNAPYTTRIVNPSGNLIPGLFGFNLGFTILGTGNPGDAGVAYGVTISVVKAATENSFATVHVVPVGG